MRSARSAWPQRMHPAMIGWLLLLFLLSAVPTAEAAGTTWLVNRAGDDVNNGDVATHSGSIRFALAHAVSGDLVKFGEFSADFIYVHSTLVVPAGVSVGGARNEADCGNYRTPRANIEDGPLFSLKPVISLGAGASLHGINLGGGDLGVKITGDDVDICGVGIGIVHDGDGYVLPLPPAHAALHVDGARATIRRNYLGGAVVVSSHGSDTRIGDTLDGSGDANDGIRDAWVSVLTDARDTGGPCASSTTAAQRVTIRDRFPRGLACLERPGVSGGDDVINHVNNWAATPIIDSASTADGTTVHVTGTASPLSVVDIYLDYAVEIDRRTTIADADGMFSYSGPLPPGEVVVYAVSTLNDPAHPNRRGSSSEWAGPLPVIMDGAEPLLSSLGSVIDLSGAGTGPARPGDILRFTVTMTNVGTVNVTNINGTNFLPPAATTILIGSGKAQGQGSGFIAIGGGFSNDTLAPGRAETYTVDALVKPTASPGMAVFSLEVNGNGIVATPVVGRMRIVTGPAPLLSPRIWLAFVSG